MEETVSVAQAENIGREYWERFDFGKAPGRISSDLLLVSESYVRRYDRPPASTIYPLEYVFHLLGNLQGETIVDLGCGEGLNTVVLAALGARVLSVDISETNLEVTGRRATANGVALNVTLLHSDAASIPIRDGVADRVLCVSTLHQLNPLLTARQIRRILRPGGSAVFKEPLAGPAMLDTMKTVLSEDQAIRCAQRPLQMREVEAVCRAVGRAGRRRVFWLTTRLLNRMGLEGHAITTASQLLDASLIRRFPSSQRFASPLVWEACKES